MTVRSETADFVQKLLVPATLSVLPNAVASRALYAMSLRSGFFEAQCEAAWNAAHEYAPALLPGEAAFKARHRMHYLADYYDIYAMRTRGAGWLTRNHVITGASPQPGSSFMALTFHYGAGMWAHQHFASLNRRTTWLHVPVSVGYRHAPVAAAVARLRLRVLRRVMANPTTEVGGSHAKLVSWLEGGGALMAMFDAPHFDQHRTTATRVLDGEFHLVTGILRLAVELGVPVYLYAHVVADRAERRWLDIEGPYRETCVAHLAERVGAFMDRKLRTDPAPWHGWHLLPVYRRSGSSQSPREAERADDSHG